MYADLQSEWEREGDDKERKRERATSPPPPNESTKFKGKLVLLVLSARLEEEGFSPPFFMAVVDKLATPRCRENFPPCFGRWKNAGRRVGREQRRAENGATASPEGMDEIMMAQQLDDGHIGRS